MYGIQNEIIELKRTEDVVRMQTKADIAQLNCGLTELNSKVGVTSVDEKIKRERKQIQESIDEIS